MFNLSSAQGARFAEVCQEMTEAVRTLGPSPLKNEPSAVSDQRSAKELSADG
jgi:hypothetical protein